MSYPTISYAEELKACLEGLPSTAIVFLDVDDTLITPKSTTFRAPPTNQLIDSLKKNLHLIENFPELISTWRLQRKVILLDEKWPFVLEFLKKRFCVYGLTKIDSGRVGYIPSMESWRYEELASFGLIFTPDMDFSTLLQKPASFFKGIFFTGALSKIQTISPIIEKIPGKDVVLVDDRLENLQEMEDFLKARGKNFIGIHYDGLWRLPGIPDPRIAALQEHLLLTEHRWIEDEDAVKILGCVN